VPEVSVVIPVYNRPQSLIAAVKSVAEQSYSDLEILVVDDGSSQSMEDARSSIEKLGARYIRLPSRSGVSRARNFGVEQGSGKWIAFLDSDDLWYPGKLERQLDFHQQNSDLSISQTGEKWIRNGRFVNAANKHRPPTEREDRLEVFDRLLELCLVSPSSVIVKRELFQRMGGFREELTVCEDYDLWLRISCAEKIGFVNEQLIEKHGGHEDQLSSSEVAMDRFRVYAIFKLLEQGVDDERGLLCMKHLLRKAEILLQGAKKRNRPQLEELFSAFVDVGKGERKLIEAESLAPELLICHD